jgi:hypothetical protein
MKNLIQEFTKLFSNEKKEFYERLNRTFSRISKFQLQSIYKKDFKTEKCVSSQEIYF